ncbi:metal-sulfur cluster assembly factor [Loigolactobacillus binensis]|uniref:Metal-sulfur cluster assembly factor n=1 Tax=Loigolactobacillus binensis TaxID=2559922 RepID=A0ABW3EAJ7_9LACO|nr:metal-sulfur cluster assembly factor [Loigolactobacillus binensis]
MRTDITINDRAAAIGDKIIAKLEKVYDTEIGLDIYNLGLIYAIDLDANGAIKIVTTFTEMVCGCIESIPVGIKEELSQLDEINQVDVEIAWAPRWKMDRISRLGRIALGISAH